MLAGFRVRCREEGQNRPGRGCHLAPTFRGSDETLDAVTRDVTHRWRFRTRIQLPRAMHETEHALTMIVSMVLKSLNIMTVETK